MIGVDLYMKYILTAIKNRRSVRKYLPDQIEDDELATILEAATYAPSGHNCQPWYFTVIQDKKMINFINDKAKQQMAVSSQQWAAKLGSSEQYHIFHHAPTVIIISGDKNARSPLPLAGTEISYTPLVDCAAAIQNMLVAAESLDIGSCWIGVVNFFFGLPEAQILGIANNYQPLFAVSLGYKDDSVSELAVPERRSNVIKYIR